MHKLLLAMALIVGLSITLAGCGNGQAVEPQKVDAKASAVWPKEWMGSLPEPKSKISSIEKLLWSEYIDVSDTTTEPTSVNVVMNEMTKQEALDYVQAIKDSGATIVSEQTETDKILLTGRLDDKTNFVFSYLFDEHFGNVSRSMEVFTGSDGSSSLADRRSEQTPDSGSEWPIFLVGDLPKPEYSAASYKVGEKGTEFEGAVQIELTEMPDGDGYIKQLEEFGYSSMTNMKIGEGVNFIGVNEQNATVQITYNYQTKACSIIYNQ